MDKISLKRTQNLMVQLGIRFIVIYRKVKEGSENVLKCDFQQLI